MRLIWTDGGRGAARARGRACARSVIGLALLGSIACGSDDGDASSTESTTGGSSTGGASITGSMTSLSAGPTTGSGTDSSATEGTSSGSDDRGSSSDEGSGDDTGSGSGSGSGSSDGGASSSSSEGGSEGTTGAIVSQACADGCAVEYECGIRWGSAEECTDWCNANLEAAANFSMFCMQAWEALSACLAGLDCDEYAQWEVPMAFPYPCSQEDDALAFECEGQ